MLILLVLFLVWLVLMVLFNFEAIMEILCLCFFVTPYYIVKLTIQGLIYLIKQSIPYVVIAGKWSIAKVQELRAR